MKKPLNKGRALEAALRALLGTSSDPKQAQKALASAETIITDDEAIFRLGVDLGEVEVRVRRR